MKQKLTILFISLYSLFCFSSSAQQKYFEKILTDEGEGNLSVRQIAQDNRGILWLATFNGLYKYEGGSNLEKHSFINNQQINPDITSLLWDKDVLWIGTNEGLARYNPLTEDLQVYVHNENDSLSISNDKVRCITQDFDGRIWIGTSLGGLNIFDSKNRTFSKVSLPGSSKERPYYIRSLYASENGNMWVGTLYNGLFQLRIENGNVDYVQRFNRNETNKPISHNRVYCIYGDNNGILAVGTRDGLNIYNSKDNSFTELEIPMIEKGSMQNYFRSIKKINNKFWISTWKGLIICDSFTDLEKGEFEYLLHDRSVAYSISNNQIMDVFKDASGVIWVGTENGLNRYDPYKNQFQLLQGEVINQLEEFTATAFAAYQKESLILTLSDGILKTSAKGIQKINTNSYLTSLNQRWYSMAVDADNTIWVGSQNGFLIKINENKQVVKHFRHSRKITPIYSIIEKPNGDLYIGTSGEGLKIFHTKTEKFTAVNGLSGDVYINDLLIDKIGRLWIATTLGIFKKEPNENSFNYYLPDDPNEVQKPNDFSDIEESVNGEIYVGGRNGLYIYSPETKKFTKKKFDGNSIWVTNMQFDSKQKLWLNLNFNKIAMLDPITEQLTFFKVNNGIRSSEYNQRGFYINSSDKLFLSSLDHIYTFDTSKKLVNNFSPQPIFGTLEVNNTDIRVGTEINGQVILEKHITASNNIVLNNQNKDFRLSFSSASHLNCEENRFRYKLHGFSENWNISPQTSVNYTSLKPGKYTFEVYGINNDGIESTTPATLDIRINPSPFLSFWAISLYVILIIGGLYQIRRIIVARLKMKEELLIERVKRDKEEKFHNERLRFYTNISHELRTPLTLIMGPIKQLVDSGNGETRNSRLHQLILNNTQRLLSLVNQLLDYRKSLHVGMKLKVTHEDVFETIQSNITSFEHMAAEKNINVQFITSGEKLNAWFDVEKFDIILFNILSNAFKYTPEFGLVTIEIEPVEANTSFKSRHVSLKITNSGKGIPKQLQEKVFERFYQVEEKDNLSTVNTGTGIGLALVKNLVELHHGKITLESDPGKSTTFSVFLPIEKEAYTDEEIFDFHRDADRRTREMNKKLDYGTDQTIFEKRGAGFKKVLIVEDNVELRDFLVDFLNNDYNVSQAVDGEQGLERCKRFNPDIIVSDVMMDNMDGLKFCKKLKETPETSHIPVILMTALATVENRMESYKTGADDYITKPFEPELLQIRIQKILETREKIKEDFQRDIQISNKDLTVSKIDEDFLNNVIELIEKNIDNTNFNIEHFAKELRVSSSRLYRKVKDITGMSPVSFLRTYRLRRAAKMLSEAQLSVTEIAYKVGFNDSLYFSKCFKKQFGVPPSKYSNL